jgi:transcriptional regulator with XRE-family HTH domain
VRAYRVERGLSQEDLAYQSGVHRTYLGGIERGERNPTFDSMNRIANALDVESWELLRRATTVDG